MNKRVSIVIFIIFLFSTTTYTCTIGVAGGKATSDGRPLLWKNRDSSGRENYALFFKGKIYDYIGVFSRERTDEIYGGVNERGFSIINSVAYDLDGSGWDNGTFMRMALEECGTVDEFEKLIKKYKGKLKLSANFGVIDSYGGASIFEVSKNSYKRFDANKTKEGYILRTNFSITGGGDVGKDRYLREKEIFQKKLKGKVNLRFLLQDVLRDITGKDGKSFSKRAKKRYYYTKNSICRPYTTSTIIIKGVLKNEPSYLTTLYFLPSNPLTGTILPLWVKAGRVPESLGMRKHSPLTMSMLKLYNHLYPEDKPYTLDTFYLKDNKTVNILDEIKKFENYVILLTEKKLDLWREIEPDEKTIFEFEDELSRELLRFVNSLYKRINLRESFKRIKTIKLKKKPISNIIKIYNALYFFGEDKKLYKISAVDFKVKKTRIKLKKTKNILLSEDGKSIHVLQNGEKIFVFSKKEERFYKSGFYDLSKFKGYEKIKGDKPQFFIFSNGSFYLAFKEKHSIYEVDPLKKKIKRKAGKDDIEGFRDGGIGDSLLGKPTSPQKTIHRGIVFSDFTNDSIRYMNELGTIITLYGEPSKGRRESSYCDGFFFKKVKSIDIDGDSMVFLSDKRVYFKDKDCFVSDLGVKGEEILPVIFEKKIYIFFPELKKVDVYLWR